MNPDQGRIRYTLPSAERSANMAAVRSRGNLSTELKFVRLCRDQRIIGWRRHVALPGRPDFVFRKQRVAIFIDGCFWHGCPKCYRCPKTNAEYWTTKVGVNRRRDRRVGRLLRADDWKVVRISDFENCVHMALKLASPMFADDAVHAMPEGAYALTRNES